MVSVREWEQSATEWARRADDAVAARDYEEARTCLGRSRRHALCAVRLRAEIEDAWAEYDRQRIAGDNPRGFPHIYFERGYEAGLAAKGGCE